MYNNTTSEAEENVLVRHICQYFILIASVIGNTFLIAVLIKLQRVQNFIEKLILNLALCNLLLVLTSIPPSLIIDMASNYPFGYLGCKLINPISTYAIHTGTFTLLVIAFERWKALSKPFSVLASKHKVIFIFMALHLSGIISIIPYMVTLEYSTETFQCTETWSLTTRKIYTVVLFVLQYGLPVPLMMVFYGRCWTVIQSSNAIFFRSLSYSVPSTNSPVRRNTNVSICSLDSIRATSIRQSTPTEDIEISLRYTKMDRLGEDESIEISTNVATTSDYIQETSSSSASMIPKSEGHKKSRIHVLCKSSLHKTVRYDQHSPVMAVRTSLGHGVMHSTLAHYISPAFGRKMAKCSVQDKAVILRFNQGRELLKMFTVVVLVFIVFMLPNQILWLMIDFGSDGNEYFNPLTSDILYIFTYANCVLNPVIYGRLNKTFRRDFRTFFGMLACAKK